MNNICRSSTEVYAAEEIFGVYWPKVVFARGGILTKDILDKIFDEAHIKELHTRLLLVQRQQ